MCQKIQRWFRRILSLPRSSSNQGIQPLFGLKTEHRKEAKMLSSITGSAEPHETVPRPNQAPVVLLGDFLPIQFQTDMENRSTRNLKGNRSPILGHDELILRAKSYDRPSLNLEIRRALGLLSEGDSNIHLPLHHALCNVTPHVTILLIIC
jgi:hypothetical protein